MKYPSGLYSILLKSCEMGLQIGDGFNFLSVLRLPDCFISFWKEGNSDGIVSLLLLQ